LLNTERTFRRTHTALMITKYQLSNSKFHMFWSTLANGIASLLLSVYVEKMVDGLYSIFVKLHHRNESLHFLFGENNLHEQS
jgi:hypothetical protein